MVASRFLLLTLLLSQQPPRSFEATTFTAPFLETLAALALSVFSELPFALDILALALALALALSFPLPLLGYAKEASSPPSRRTCPTKLCNSFRMFTGAMALKLDVFCVLCHLPATPQQRLEILLVDGTVGVSIVGLTWLNPINIMSVRLTDPSEKCLRASSRNTTASQLTNRSTKDVAGTNLLPSWLRLIH